MNGKNQKIGKYITGVAIGMLFSVCFLTNAGAVPILQVGVEDGSGGYVAYQANSTDPTEEDTAITSGNNIVVAGIYKKADALLLGGQYSDGEDWSDISYGKVGGDKQFFPDSFNGRGAVLMASVADGSLADAAGLTVNGNTFFATSTISFFPNEHDPVKDDLSGFLFFDIGNFAKNIGAVPNFEDGTEDAKDGEIKKLTLAGQGDLAWIHFDVMALRTYGEEKHGGKPSGGDGDGSDNLYSTVPENNPGSHDVTWKYSSEIPLEPIPEPATVLLLGIGLAGLAGAEVRRRRKKRAVDKS